MIEFLNARRMIAVIGILILLCIIIVILEDTITDNVDKHIQYHPSKLNQSESHLNNLHPSIGEIVHKNATIPLLSHCWKHEKFTIESKCSICSARERKLSSCIETGYKEHLRCEVSGDVFRSCDNSNSSMFWVFEFFMIFTSVVFNFYVHKRQSFVNRLILERIEKQISSGV